MATANINEMIASLQNNSAEIPTILFRATQVADYTMAAEIIIFTEMLYNVGGGYNSLTGKFTAPVAGIYLFTVNLCQRSGKHILYQRVANRNVLANRHTYSVAGCLFVSGDATVQLDVNNVVCVKSQYISNELVSAGILLNSYDAEFNSFSGVLLH